MKKIVYDVKEIERLIRDDYIKHMSLEEQKAVVKDHSKYRFVFHFHSGWTPEETYAHASLEQVK